MINYGGHEDADITRVNAQFVECDKLSINEQLSRIAGFPLPPSVIVKTKKSLHCYWLMRDAKLEAFRRVQKRLVAQFDGDPVCVNESRVFRLPGFYHCKAEPVMVECIKFDPELRYTQDELETKLPPVPDEPAAKSPAPRGTQRGLPLVTNRCLFIRHCRESAATLPESLWYGMITNLAVFEGGESGIHALSSGYPNYQQAETQEKIAHFLDSGTKPVTCATLAERGYQCPRLGDESCGCKAPAALAYKAPDVEEIRTFLGGCEVKESAVDNVQTARDFVSDYLFNVEPVIGEAFIGHELREHFGFKAADVKRLLVLHKDLYRKNGEGRVDDERVKLPPWYVRSGKSLRFIPGVLAGHMAKEIRAFYCTEQYYIYRDGVYQDMSDLEARSLVQEHLNPKFASMANITDAEGQWRLLILKPISEINTTPMIINVKNGLYNVATDTILPHTPDNYSTVQLNVNYSPSAQCPRFKLFLEESLYSDDIPLVQEMLGYFLVPVNKAQKSFVVVGEAGAGKSKLLLTLNEILLGPKNVSNIPWQTLNERFKAAELVGKLANIFADLPTKNIDDNGIYKALVGEDFLTAERKNKDPFTFKPFVKLLFSCNSIPRNYGDKSEGFYRRLIIIRFAHAVPEEKRDAQLMDKFAAEADGIFMFALEGLKRLIANEYRFSESKHAKAELQKYKVESSSVLSFVEDCCEMVPDGVIERGELYTRYREYCREGGLMSVSQRVFNRDVETTNTAVVRGRDKTGNRRVWRGVRVLPDGERV